ncbi:MAG: hypothetical protein IJ087_09135 [Eggerthellaceae bacterium]|nr:hypothetical protein [Eggerthellaceae bacterium]
MLPPPDNSTCYARTQLSGGELRLYDDIVATLQMGQTTLNAKRINANRALDITMLVLRDHPEFYWVAGEASLGGFNGKLKLTKHLAPNKELESFVMAEFDRLMSNLPPSCSDYTKAKTFYTAVAGYASYDNREVLSDEHLIVSHSLWGVFGERLAVCDGFSSALQYLLQHAGIQAYRLTGTASSALEHGPHSWVLAKIDGEYYHCDPTWGAMPLDNPASNPNIICVNYDYLCMCDRDVTNTHHAREIIHIQACTSKAANYYNQEGLLIRFWDERIIIDALIRQIERGYNWLSLRAATKSLFARLKNACQDGELLAYLLQEAIGKHEGMVIPPIQYEYMINDELKTIHVLTKVRGSP